MAFSGGDPVHALPEDRRPAFIVRAREPGHPQMQPRRVTHHRKVRHDAFDVIAQPTGPPARGALRIDLNELAVDVGEILGDSGAGDPHPQLDGSADGVRDKAAGSVSHGSCGLEEGVKNLHPRPAGPPTCCGSPHHRRTRPGTLNPEEPL
jgi:hypothetical protein